MMHLGFVLRSNFSITVYVKSPFVSSAVENFLNQNKKVLDCARTSLKEIVGPERQIF